LSSFAESREETEMSQQRRYELTDEEWAKLEPLLPAERGHWGRPRISNRQVLNGMFWILRSGAPWRDLPERYGPWKTVYNRFNRWAKAGVFETVFQTLVAHEPIDETLMIDSTIVRAHQQAAGAKGGR
jgi:transposase